MNGSIQLRKIGITSPIGAALNVSLEWMMIFMIDPSSPMPKGKQGMNVENFKALLPYSIVDGNTVDDLVFRKNLNFDVAIFHSLIDDDRSMMVIQIVIHSSIEARM